MVISRFVNRTLLRRTTFAVLPFALAAGLARTQDSVQAPAPASAQPYPPQKNDRPPQPGQLPPKDEPGVAAPGKTSQGEDKRVFGVLPNYRTAEMNAKATPLTPGQKLRIAAKDSFDYPLLILGAAYGGLYQAENSHPEFGQGAKGYFSRFATSYSDQVIGNMMTEAFLPILLREDPRYFRMAEGPKMKRALYALSRIVVTHTDAGATSFNYSEVVGNGIAAGIGLSYYPDDRDVGDYMQNWGIQLGTDAASQVLKEFWPDIKRWWLVRHHKGELNP